MTPTIARIGPSASAAAPRAAAPAPSSAAALEKHARSESASKWALRNASRCTSAAAAEDGEDEEMADADDDNREVSAAKRAKRAAASLRQLDATLFLDALMEALETGKRPHMKAALRAVQTFIDGVMTLACDSAVTGVSEEEAEQAKEAVAVAKMDLAKLEGQVLLCSRYLIDFRQYFQVVLQVL